MKTTVRDGSYITAAILIISSIFWIILLLNPGGMMGIKHCHMTADGVSNVSLKMMLQMNPFSDMMTGWILMVLAMMLPKLISPVQYIYARSLKRRRFWLSLLFVLSYTMVWTVMGVVMNAVILGFNLLFPGGSYIPSLIIGVIALIWQFSPVKQLCLNRGHDHSSIAAFGWAADRDVLKFGMMHGIWCIGSGWALMLFPMILPEGHNLAMILVTFIMISEHMEHPRYPRWYFDFRLKLLRIMVGRIKINFKRKEEIQPQVNFDMTEKFL